MAIETKDLATVGSLRIALAESTLAGEYSQERLEAAFARVKPATHWKDRIDALVPAELARVAAAAVEHFTGTEAAVGPVDRDGFRRITAPGYWAGPCN